MTVSVERDGDGAVSQHLLYNLGTLAILKYERHPQESYFWWFRFILSVEASLRLVCEDIA
jgi:hypothetical protein